MRRARRSFWILFLVAVVAAGGLSWSVTASAGPVTAAVFAASALVLVAALALDVRILTAVERRRVH